MTCGRNVFLKYGLGANSKRLSEIWFGCETSFQNMFRVRDVFLNYEDGAKRLSYLCGVGETSFLFGAKPLKNSAK